MRITLLDPKVRRTECVNRDFMAGYGWAFHVGKSPLARLIELVKKRGEKLPLMSFGYLAAVLHANGHEVRVSSEEFADADLVILPSSMVEYSNEIEWATRIKQQGINVGFVGPFATARPDLFLPHCDFVISGEPEEAAMRISESWLPEGVVVSKPIVKVDELPFPKWDLFPIESYSYLPALKERPFLPILSGRGCYYTCDYCPYKDFYQWRNRSVDNVMAEIEHLVDKFGVRAMLFRDPIFSAPKQRAREISEEFIKRNIKLRWACETRLDLLDEELLEVMYEAGLRVVNVGVESSSDTILRNVKRRPITVDHQEAMIRYCDKLGIRVTAFYVLGLDGDTPETIADTVRYAKKLNTHAALFFINTPFPGTPPFDKVKDRLLTQTWEQFDCYTPVVRHDHLSPQQLSKLKEKAFLSYYYRPRYAVSFLRRVFRDLLDPL